MSVTLSADGVIVLAGDCPIEEAEVLLRYLAENRAAPVDWSGCDQAHTAVIQVLLAAPRPIMGLPRTDFLRHHVAPALKRP
jgi:hypothetical protein